MDARYLRRLPPYVYLHDLFRGRRVLELAAGEGDGAHYLLQSGARAVTGVDRSARAIDAARARYRAQGLEFRSCDYAGLELDDRQFDVVCVPVGADALRQLRVLEECRRVLVPGGQLVLVAQSADRPEARGGISYHELCDRLGALFGPVRMMGIAPFVGFSLVEYGEDAGEVLEIDLDTQLANLGDPNGDPVTDYVAVAGRGVADKARGYTVVQLPVQGGLQAAAAARAGNDSTGLAEIGGDAAERVRVAEALAADATARLREVEAELGALRRSSGRAETEELRRRLARAVDERSSLEAQTHELQARLGEADVELGRVAAQSALEIGELRAEAARTAERIARLEAELAAARRASAPVVPRASAPVVPVASAPVASAPVVSAPAVPVAQAAPVAPVVSAPVAQAAPVAPVVSTPVAPAAPVAPFAAEPAQAPATETAEPLVSVEFLRTAALRHEQALAEVRAELDERDAYIEELCDEARKSVAATAAIQAAGRAALARTTGLEAELREVRGRMARAEGEALRLKLQAAADGRGAGMGSGAQTSGPATPAAASAADPGLLARIAELERALTERAQAVDKHAERWKAAEHKSDELWRKIGEMQRELEQNREAAVESARAQRQAAQVALTRAVDEASKKLVSCQDQVLRSEKERKVLEHEAKSLRERCHELEASRTELEAQLAQAAAAPARLAPVGEGAEAAGLEEQLEAIQAAADAKVQTARARIELLEAAAARRRLNEAALQSKVDELEGHLAELSRGLREEEARLGELEENLRVVHSHAGLVPDPSELERELVAHAAQGREQAQALANRDEKLAALAAELGQRDAELIMLHARVANAERSVSDVVAALRRTSAELAGRSPVEIAAALDRLAAETAEAAPR
jgi:hypothetical protein